MSRIFEALQQSESERTGIPYDESVLEAAELLRVAESRAAGSLSAEYVPVQLETPKVETQTDDVDRKPVVHSLVSAQSRVVALADQWSLAAEKFRLLELRLRELQKKRPLKSVLVTSTGVGEGKSFVCANLTVTMSRKKEEKVLLIDGDLRRPVLTERFGLGHLPGLNESLKDGKPVAERIYRVQDLGFWFLPAGTQSDNALELMQSGNLSETLSELGRSFDWIVIDSPPLLPLADATLWSRIADGTLLVTRQNVTEQRALQRGIEMLEKGCIVGVVINGSANTEHSKYYQYYGYGTPANAVKNAAS